MNRKIGFISSVVMSCAVAVFLICLIVALFAPNAFTENLSYGICAILSWGYVAAACAYSCYAKKAASAAAKIGVSIGVIYSTIISVVYFTQITTVLHKSADEKILEALDFTAAGSWMFNMDLLGYGLLAVSTFFVGLTLKPENKADKALKILLMLHGAFGVCMFAPVLPLPATNQGAGGTIALIGWCLFFLPICILSAVHFKGLKDSAELKNADCSATES